MLNSSAIPKLFIKLKASQPVFYGPIRHHTTSDILLHFLLNRFILRSLRDGPKGLFRLGVPPPFSSSLIFVKEQSLQIEYILEYKRNICFQTANLVNLK